MRTDQDFPTKRLLRMMAWERAKGELNSMGATFVGELEQFEAFTEEVDRFVTHVEDNGLHE